MANLKITLHHGLVNRTPKQRATAQSLGLRKIGQSVTPADAQSEARPGCQEGPYSHRSW